MTVYALIINEKVHELYQTTYDITKIFHKDMVWIPVPSILTVEVGWNYINNMFTEPEPVTLTLKQQAQTALSIGCNITWANNSNLTGIYSIDNLSQMKILTIETGILAGKSLPGGGNTVNYPDKTKTIHQFTTEEFTTFSLKIRDYVFALEAVIGGSSTTLPLQPILIS